MPEALTYTQAGVDYSSLDSFKRHAQKKALGTASNLEQVGFAEVTASRGESAYVVDMGNFYLAMTPEGLGTKNLVADSLGQQGDKLHHACSWDTVAMIVNDLITVGARPVVVTAHFATGESRWFENTNRSQALIDGWSDACDEAGAAYGSGETAVLKGVIYPKTIELSGAGVGIIQPKERLTLGDRLEPADHIVLIESSGIHANGLSLARKIAEEILGQGYETQLPSGRTFAEALLSPTHIYARLVEALFESKVDIRYMVNITGHGWRKLMRLKRDLTYRMIQIPQAQEEFAFMQEAGNIPNEEMYSTFNMGAGFAFYVPRCDVTTVCDLASQLGFQSLDAGVVEEGPRQVIIGPKNIVFPGETLQIR